MIIELIDFDTALAQINDDLRVVNSSHIHQKILEASAMVMEHLKLTAVPDAWSDDPDASPIVYTVPFNIQAATSLLFAELWANRESSNYDPSEKWQRPLIPRRTPTMA